ncbi:MAG: short-chain dehydrogenase, partial [Ginsengibacter sp.]
WVKSYLKNKPKPMGQIYEPEVAAKAVLEVARNPRREMYVGYPTLETIWGNKVLPDFLDHYLARTGFKGQQTNEPESADRQNNLWQPVPGDHGARGTFSADAWNYSPEVWMTTHKKTTWGLLAGLAIGIGAIAVLKNKK